MFYVFTVDGKDYRLILSVENVVALEKKIGKNPLMIFGNGDRIPTVEEMIYILHYSLARFNHSITLTDTYDIFQNWLQENHVYTDFIPVIIDIYRVSGLIKKEEENEKN